MQTPPFSCVLLVETEIAAAGATIAVSVAEFLGKTLASQLNRISGQDSSQAQKAPKLLLAAGEHEQSLEHYTQPEFLYSHFLDLLRLLRRESALPAIVFTMDRHLCETYVCSLVLFLYFSVFSCKL